MRKLFIATLVAVTVTTSAFSADVNKVNAHVNASFRKDFGNVVDVQWKNVGSYSSASFVENNKRIQAFYDYKGELVATTYSASIDDLPTSSKRALASRYANYTITEAMRFENSDETAYFVKVKKDDKELILKVTGGLLSVFSNTGK